jgi:archaeosortase C (PEF-CTERM variant)
MDTEAWAAFAALHRRVIVLFALLTTFAGVALIIDQPKGTVLEWLSVPLLVGGGSVFAWALLPRHAQGVESPPSLASRLLRRLTWQGRLVSLFPIFGIAIVLADIGYNLTVSATPALQTEDIIVLLGAATIIAYPVVPARFARERDFVLVFFVCLNAVLVLPLLVARAYTLDFDRSVDVYSWVALAPQTSAVLSLLGVSNSVHPVAGSTAPGLTFVPQHFPVQVTVVITTACSGIYSFGIFASAFVSFILTEYERMDRKVWVLLGMGFLTSYVANVLRMVVIVLVGYYTDTTQSDLQNMLIAHSYAGWLIFLAWISLFWAGLFRILPREIERRPDESTRLRSGRKEPMCGICSNSLTPIVPATRCSCGSVFHERCLTVGRRCPACGTAHVGAGTPVAPT